MNSNTIYKLYNIIYYILYHSFIILYVPLHVYFVSNSQKYYLYSGYSQYKSLYRSYMTIYYSDIMIHTSIFIYTVDSDCMMSIDKMEFYIRACFSLHILFLQIIYYNRFNLLLFSFVANIQRTEQEAQTIATVVKSKSLEILENSFLKYLRDNRLVPTWYQYYQYYQYYD